MANIKYEEAIRQIEEIVDRLENDDIDIDTLGPELKKAQKLIKMCKDKLTKKEEEVKKILDEDDYQLLGCGMRQAFLIQLSSKKLKKATNCCQ